MTERGPEVWLCTAGMVLVLLYCGGPSQFHFKPESRVGCKAGLEAGTAQYFGMHNVMMRRYSGHSPLLTLRG
jgi:hypothetical protein